MALTRPSTSTVPSSGALLSTAQAGDIKTKEIRVARRTIIDRKTNLESRTRRPTKITPIAPFSAETISQQKLTLRPVINPPIIITARQPTHQPVGLFWAIYPVGRNDANTP